MKRALIVLAVCAVTTRAHADGARGNQLQLDLGIGVVGLGLEAPIADRLAWQVEAIGLSTLYLPLIGGGVTMYGYGAGTRVSWLAKRDGTGLYVAGSARFGLATGEKAGEPGRGLLLAPALTVGQAFRTSHADIRVGFGAQWIHYNLRTEAGHLTADVPFLMVELILGFRR